MSNIPQFDENVNTADVVFVYDRIITYDYLPGTRQQPPLFQGRLP